ncbi:hypothetical protein DERF_011955 [Dermatophagoides farinae]|uniref:Uncharacterized protein n=1 Tax=Dermatophagoides farinae TaxID=6954 RepID=A0A922HT44_DERFA|nr:hypothetical protein DERF_011955 [Dermatophagoides farinae]
MSRFSPSSRLTSFKPIRRLSYSRSTPSRMVCASFSMTRLTAMNSFSTFSPAAVCRFANSFFTVSTSPSIPVLKLPISRLIRPYSRSPESVKPRFRSVKPLLTFVTIFSIVASVCGLVNAILDSVSSSSSSAASFPVRPPAVVLP